MDCNIDLSFSTKLVFVPIQNTTDLYVVFTIGKNAKYIEEIQTSHSPSSQLWLLFVKGTQN